MSYVDNQNDIFKRITDASRRGTLSFFVGAGVSAVSKAPKWSELIDVFCEKLGKEKKDRYTSEEYLSIPQKYYCSINNDIDEFYKIVESCFNKTELQPNIIHYLMCSLKPCNFITTNFDDLIEKSVVQHCLHYKSVACDAEIGGINGDNYILKVHGDLAHKNIVLKEEDYLNYSENFKLIETILKSIFSTNTVVFIGYGLNDYNIKLILNWAKFLLKDSFNTPIFIYTDNEELDKNDILYQESRGLKVLDYRNCTSNANIPFLERYKCVLNKIIKYSDFSFENKNELEEFKTLYNILAPLDEFETLRVYDIKKALGKYAYVETNGVIRIDDEAQMKLLIKLVKGEVCISKDIQNMYTTIKSVFNKALILGIRQKEEFYSIDNESKRFADDKCILFNYNGMEKFLKKESNSLLVKYKKAYYLSKLKRYKESLDIFQEVAEHAFKEKNYLLCYLSQINCRSLSMAIKNISSNPFIGKNFELNEVEELALESRTTENIFKNMPIEFQMPYKNFSDLYSAEHLYKNAYEMFIENEKLRKNMGKNVMEAGITSADMAILRINNNIHFMLGNGLFIDEFTEFRETIKHSLKLIVEKYSLVNKKIIANESPFRSKNSITFDEIDVYCFIEYFKSDEIISLMSKCNIKDLAVNNKELIDLMICNLFNYYDKAISSNADYFIVASYQQKMKTCLKLLRYITVSPKTIKQVCKVIFKYGFREIYLNDIILFLDSQISRNKISCKMIRKELLAYLIRIIEENIEAINKGEQYEIPRSSTGFEYWHYARYLKSDKEKFVSKKLSDKISWILENKIDIKLKSLYECKDVINSKTRKQLMGCIKSNFADSFDFDLFTLFIEDKKFVSSHIKSLKKYLDNLITTTNSSKNKSIAWPIRDSYEDLVNVGYWCLSGYLNKTEFSEYMGVYDKFDFYYNPEEFDYNKFDIGWLIGLTEGAYKAIFKEKNIKEKITECIGKNLREYDIEQEDKEDLIKILAQYAL